MNPGRQLTAVPGSEELTAFQRWVNWPAFVLLAAGAGGMFLTGWEASGGLVFLPFALSALIYGMPHGALDHLCLLRLLGWPLSFATVAAVVVIYLAFSALYLGIWILFPLTAALSFLALTWLHWGQGDLHALRSMRQPYAALERSRLLRVSTILVRGGFPMLLPLLAHPDGYLPLLRRFAGLFMEPAAAEQAYLWMAEPGFLAAASWSFAGMVLADLTMKAWSERGFSSPWRQDALEVILLSAWFVAAPPIFAIGMYFMVWHGARHVWRLMLWSPGCRRWLEEGQYARALGRFALLAAPATLGALALVAVLYAVTVRSGQDPLDLLAVYLVGIACLTFPHVLIVVAMDQKEGFRSPGAV